MSRHLESTPATQRRCAHCGTPTLRATVEGLTVTVDATPLDQQTEIAALVNNLRTYTLTQMRKELIHRTGPRIRRRMPIGTIHAQHVCPIAKPAAEQMQFEFGIGIDT